MSFDARGPFSVMPIVMSMVAMMTFALKFRRAL